MDIGERICELRKKAGWSQEELAVKLEVTRQSVSKWESGRSYPDITILPQLAAVLNCSVSDFFACGDDCDA